MLFGQNLMFLHLLKFLIIVISIIRSFPSENWDIFMSINHNYLSIYLCNLSLFGHVGIKVRRDKSVELNSSQESPNFHRKIIISIYKQESKLSSQNNHFNLYTRIKTFFAK